MASSSAPCPKHKFFLFEFEKDGSVDVGPASVFERLPDLILQSKSYILHWPNQAAAGSGRGRKSTAKFSKYSAKVIMSGGML
jgi:hypothetical protein